MFLKISDNSQENTCVRESFNKVAGLTSAFLLKRGLWHRYFPVNQSTVFIEHLQWLHLRKDLLIYFIPPVSFCTSQKHETSEGFLMFSEGIEKDQWDGMG